MRSSQSTSVRPTARLRAEEDSDFVPVSGTLRFAPGETSKRIIVPTIDVQDLPGLPTVDDFHFRIGNDSEPYGKDLHNPTDD